MTAVSSNGPTGAAFNSQLGSRNMMQTQDDYGAGGNTMDAFKRLKPICVQLMGLAGQAPTSYSQHAPLMDKLEHIFSKIPHSSLSVNLINYSLFPVTQILRNASPADLPDIFLESSFRLLARLVSAWRRLPGGVSMGVWEQLWRYTMAAVGPRLGSGGKGKSKEMSQEAQLQAVTLLSALLDTSSPGHPTVPMLEKASGPKAPLMPTLFQTITLLLELISPVPPHTALQLNSLRSCRNLLRTYLKGQHPVLASVLPGVVSSAVKVLSNGVHGLKGDIAAEILGLVEDVVTMTLADKDLRRLSVLRSGLDDLGQLADEWDDQTRSSPEPSAVSEANGKDPFPPLSKSYLDFTSARLLAAIRPLLSTASAHPLHQARLGGVSLAAALLEHCRESLPRLIPLSLSTILLLSRDDFDPVRDKAEQRLADLLSTHAIELEASLMDLLSESINALPRLITSHQDDNIVNAAKLLMALSDATSPSSTASPFVELLGPRGKVERWGWALMDCLEFGRPAGWSTMDNTAARTAEMGWQNRLLTTDISLLMEGGFSEPHLQTFPTLALRYIDHESTIKAISEALVSLGRAGGESALHSVDYFIRFARAQRSENPAQAASALWIAQQLLDGIARGQLDGEEGKISKAVRKMAKEVTRNVVSIDDAEDEDDEVPSDRPTDATETEDALLPVERTRGVDTITSLLDRPIRGDTHATKETNRLHIMAQRSLLTALSLSSLSLTSRILSSSFRPLLLNSLYVLLSHLSSAHTLIATYAEVALAHVAYNTGYASVQNLILDNVDYVINVVSQRLTPARLSPTAPLVLIAMIRLTRSEIVPMVHDVVDEIFEALDDYHGYELLASGLLAVLVTLVDVMNDDVKGQELSEARQQKLAEMRRIASPPNPESDFKRFEGWWEERAEIRKAEVDRILETAPKHAWGKPKTEAEEVPEGGEASDAAMDGDEENKPTRTQEICTLILDKSLNFLSHSSPFLRARILSLISHAIPVLAGGNREGDLLPLVDRSWGIILRRLEDPLPYVVTEAAEVIAGLCENCGDFMVRRTLDGVWPRLKKLLDTQVELDKRSALARKGGIGTESAWTVSHRLHLAVLSIAMFVAREVPVEDQTLWDLMVTFRPFIDVKAHDEIQAKAMELYQELGRRDGDALWSVLQATSGAEAESLGVWTYLRDERLQLGHNAVRILSSI